MIVSRPSKGGPVPRCGSSGRRVVGLLVVASAFLGGSCGSPDAPARSLLLVTLDTTRADHLSPYGAEGVHTPHLQRLADEGVVASAARAVAPITLPAHASMLTGLYPWEHGVRSNEIHRLAPDVPTVTEALSRAGFRTAAFVSAAVLDRRYGLDRGFELYDDELGRGGAVSRLVAERPGAETVAAARRWLDQLDPADRFFLWVHLFDPHAEYRPPEPWADRLVGRPYDGEIAAMDDAFGRLLDHRALRDERRVAVLAVGDHGEGLGDHGEPTHGLLVFESTMRVPWIAKWPESPRGVGLDAPVSQIDVAATVLDLLGVDPGSAVPPGGESLRRGVRDRPSPRVLGGESLVGQSLYGWSALRTVWQGSLKLVVGPEPQLFDLSTDPGERHDLMPEGAQRAAPLWRALATMDSSTAPTLLGPDEAEMERLRSLGYLPSGRSTGDADSSARDPRRLLSLHLAMNEVEGLLFDDRPAEAADRAREVLQQDPRNRLALRYLGDSLARLGAMDEAAEALSSAVDVAPGDPVVMLRLASVEAARGEEERALTLVERILEADPHSLEAQLERARLLDRLGRRAEAREQVDLALSSAPRSPWANLRYAQLVELPAGRVDAAASRLRRLLSGDPTFTEAWLLLAQGLARSGRPEEARAVYRDALEVMPGSYRLWAELGRLLAEEGDPGAGAALEAAIASSPHPQPELEALLGAALDRGVGNGAPQP